jgi:hypothetical protein
MEKEDCVGDKSTLQDYARGTHQIIRPFKQNKKQLISCQLSGHYELPH